MDIIFIDDLRVNALIGIYPREQVLPQTLEISLQLGTSTASAGESDDIADTIDYTAVVAWIHAELAVQQFGLLEKLAEHLAKRLLTGFGAKWVRISIAKPGVLRNVRRAGIVIEREAPSD